MPAKSRIELTEDFRDSLAALSAFQRTRLNNEIEAQLSHTPDVKTKNRKPLYGLVAPWYHQTPLWELKVGEYRSFMTSIPQLGWWWFEP